MSLRQDVLRSQSIDSYVVLDNNPDNNQAEHDSDDESYVNVVRIQSTSQIIGWLKLGILDIIAWDTRTNTAIVAYGAKQRLVKASSWAFTLEIEEYSDNGSFEGVAD